MTNGETKNAIEICRGMRRYLAMRQARAESDGAPDFVVQEINEQHDALSHVLGLVERYEATDWLIGRLEYAQLQGDMLIEAKDGEGYVAIRNSDDEYNRETVGAFDTLQEAVEALQETK